MIIQKLYDVVAEKGCVCVGLDITYDTLPKSITEKYHTVSEQMFEFNKAIIDATSDIAAIYKPQIAFYEAMGIEGLIAYKRTMEYLKSRDLLSIGDIKRGDIASTAQMYAKAHLAGEFETDFITLNPYMGFDSITPYLDYVKTGDKGLFVLLRTSNEGAKDIEFLKLENGDYVYNAVGDGIAKIASEFQAECGYSPVCAVVGGTHKEHAVEIRERFKNIFFLIPGYGAQGATGDDVRLYLNDNNGAVVNASRSIIYAFKKYEDGDENFDKYAREAVLKMRLDINGF